MFRQAKFATENTEPDVYRQAPDSVGFLYDLCVGTDLKHHPICVIFNGTDHKGREVMTKAISCLAVGLVLVLGCKLGAETRSANELNASSPSISTNASGTMTEVNVPETSPTPIRQAANAVCPDPAKPCHHKSKTFDEWELSFKLPAKIVPNKTYSSAPFYALILKEYGDVEDCDGGEYVISAEEERKALQRIQPTRKVFVDYQCPNMAAVGYDFPGRSDSEKILISNFLAIYAGQTKTEADALLAELKTKYPKAVIKQMTASYENMQQ